MSLLSTWAAAVVALSLQATPSGSSDRCRTGPIDRAAVIACAKRVDPRVAADEAARQAVAERRTTARVVLPSNPELEVNAASRQTTGLRQSDWNMYATLRQEVEIGGQRKQRIASAAAESEVVAARSLTTEREIKADALAAYYDVIAARERRDVVQRAEHVAVALAELAKGRELAGTEAGLTADLAAIEAVGLRRRALQHRRNEGIAVATLARRLGLSPRELPEVVGELEPIPVRRDVVDPSQRSELVEARATVRWRARQTKLARRELVPSPKFAVFVQRDGFAELVLGGGVVMPIPMPAPVGPFAKSRVAEARAAERQAAAELDVVTRGLRLEADVALEDLAAQEAITALYDEETTKKAREDLDSLTRALSEGRIGVREAL